IAKTMPDDDPGACVGEDAQKVAAYIHEAFYSRTAQARNKPARIELSRLTVRQYRNAVADLVGSFRNAGSWGVERGLRGQYFKSRRRGGSPAFERVDPEVKFDFGVDAPAADKDFDAAQFSIRWDGSVLAPETGEYEFILRTDHAAQLWVNDTKKPLIDGLVQSGSDLERRESIFLLGGRAYPLRLEFSKAKQGVDDSKKNKPKPVNAQITLLWKLPHQVAEVIPARNLSPTMQPETFVVTTAFPPDDRSVGYERGTSVSKEWDQATTEAAIEVADSLVANLADLAGVRNDAPDREPRIREFCRRFAERAFRRPLTEEQQRLFVDHQFEKAPDPDTAVKRLVLLVLKSPRFLYREMGGSVDAYDVASRLSFGLWDSLPDKELLDAAAAGKLATREQVAQQAERMVPDLRTRSKIRAFFMQWLKVDLVPDLSKDPSRFPDFNEAIASDLRTSLDLFLEEVVWSDASDFRQLMLGDFLHLNGRLARFYGADLPPDAPFQKISLSPVVRAGVLSHPYLMASFSYTSTTSPIHRGVFLARSVLGKSLRPPPEAVAPLAPDLHPSLSTRERVLLQTSPKACQTCHGMINPLGFTLEHFDAVGRYQSEEQGKPLDTTGGYLTRTGDLLKFAGVRDLAQYLAKNEETHAAFVEQLFHHLVKQPIRAFGSKELPDLLQSFSAHEFNIHKLMVEIMASTALAAPDAKPASTASLSETPTLQFPTDPFAR
ncbi:MAG TPA: DUF1592 domain-containing protein, partial [Isosphaeraceae bacterium]|nr:DUF1592 domain-containing protein [Isosphaeraceae bacterium]